ncbi:class I SAM-dependent methyltransferase [Chitinophagaceae bacterium LB-8]|uniref:Class I SAM-dependent methyltransferase n=2 Tax=Paraflavisolibacter caeni TaxID=2982496 RepID=A0A9X2XWT7_9BACT|nr:class I SAM-dependent methyltransferase [Paraflavisolibacter caeni]MCU7550706.1 class I SAM-dependent methyltransferase [Paraflavisolibacter caeni]
MGRWSTLMADVFLQWLNFPYHKSWLDLGCGTGALSEAISNSCKPDRLSCVDTSSEFLSKAKEKNLPKTDFYIGSSSNIPISDNTFDIVVSGLALNFFPDIISAFSEMKRVVKPGGTIAAYVWDYSGKMEFLRLFWDTVREIDTEGYKFDEGVRFPICNTEQLHQIFEEADLIDVESSYLDIATVFKNFDDFWNPFLGGQGPAPSYLALLSPETQEQLKSAIQKKMPIEFDGLIKLKARAIAIQGQLKS